MPNVTVTIVGKAEPEMGKKRGRIKDTAGMLYQIAPTLLPSIIPGQSYNLEYTDDAFTNQAGQTFKFRVVESIMPATGMPQAPSYQPPPPQRQYDQAQQRPAQSAMPDTKTEDISVLAIVKCQQLPVGDRAGIFHALKASALAWRDFKKWQKTLAAEMDDDEIPL